MTSLPWGPITAFDVLAMDGDDLRQLPLTLRKTNLARLLARRPDGIFVAPLEQGEIGPDLFRAACRMGLEGLVSKRRDRAYRGGRCPHWVKVKNPNRTFAEMRGSGVRGILLYCADYHCSHCVAMSADASPDDVRLSDIEPRFVCQACGHRGADVRPDFNWDRMPVRQMG